MTEPVVLLETRLFRVMRESFQDDRGREHRRDIVRHPGAVAIVPVLDDGRICLIENYRTAVHQTLLELPAGTREPGEQPIETARRELAEETGYRADALRPMTEFFMSPGILDERMYLFVATGLRPGKVDLQGGEQITSRLTTWDEAIDMIRNGRIQDAKTIAGLLYYGAFCR